jgi:hypothetical protein
VYIYGGGEATFGYDSTVHTHSAPNILRRIAHSHSRPTFWSTVYDYIEHTHEMSRVNGATDALSIDPSAGYIPFLVIVHVLLLFTAYVSSDTHMYIHVVHTSL